jgi:hypothetical protein
MPLVTPFFARDRLPPVCMRLWSPMCLMRLLSEDSTARQRMHGRARNRARKRDSRSHRPAEKKSRPARRSLKGQGGRDI